MPHTRFSELFPKIATRETRVITIPENSDTEFPVGSYAFVDFYCNESDCDCRNVFIQVTDLKSGQSLATISYGWEPIAYYRKWMGSGEDDKAILENFKGPALVPFSIQSQYAKHWLDLFKEVIRTDNVYADRLQRHYRLVKGLSGK